MPPFASVRIAPDSEESNVFAYFCSFVHRFGFCLRGLRELTRFKEEGYDATFVVRRDELDSGMLESLQTELKGALGRPKARTDKLLRHRRHRLKGNAAGGGNEGDVQRGEGSGRERSR